MTAVAPARSGAAPDRRARRIGLVLPVLAVLLVAGVVLSAGLGQLAISPGEVVASLLRAVGLDQGGAAPDALAERTLWQIRFPRIAMALLVGGALAVAGVVMQAIFGNPLAEPGVVGVSSGAAVGAAASITLGLSLAGVWTTALLAFLGGLGATLIVYGAARVQGRADAVRLVLTGVAVNAFAGALLAVLMFAGSTASREQIVFWQLGSMNGSRWGEVAVVAAVIAAAGIAAFGLGPRYDLLALGDRTAAHLGVRVERLRILSVVLVALLTGVAVAFVGIIAFVGLVVPHLFRGIIGPSARPLMLASFLGGGALLVYADLLARTAVPASDLPIGILTSLIGGPFFFVLIRRNRGGWA
ncbi:iron complex transport system permease protein [Microbacterium resistens]|uniref:Iron complex transport system permease protein n=1 Tax=Microbacterium resistens TaxID=156977 RepID=A0ABU1SAN1_9MICO|nr:iron ABC transporter permease [Microbacterium resistens]MDR6866631.1 iron complex transport system permease protein [Microbacterium resistens]